jgi:hypothetical protein
MNCGAAASWSRRVTAGRSTCHRSAVSIGAITSCIEQWCDMQQPAEAVAHLSREGTTPDEDESGPR